MSTYAIQAGALRTNPNSGPDGVGVQADVAYTLEARAEVQAVCAIGTPANDNAHPAPATTVVGEPLRFLSVCSGIEAASVAWKPLGWKAVAFSEIEKFPSAVLAHLYPDVPNLGDFTKIDTTTLGQVDILCGGTPCQAFSVAGLRQSLDDARGNLSLEFVRLAHELAAGNGLRNVVWENVVGVLSTKDNAFGCFLGGLVGAASPIEPPTRGRWGSAGLVAGPKGRAAWRVVDAQYFGVAQRRSRVLVVADFGNGADPAKVLFELEGVQRYSAPSREAGKDVAPTISARTKGGGGLDTDFDLDGGPVESSMPVAWSIMPQNSGKDYKARQVEVSQPLMAGGPVGGNQGGDYIQQPVAYAPEIARCDATREGSSQDYETTTMVAQTVAIRGREGGATAELGGGDKPHVLAFTTEQTPKFSHDCALTLTKQSPTGGGQIQSVAIGSAVRRLTPTECERLQGFSDGYTAIPWRGKPADQCPDGPRYKALGNSWAVPKFVWLGRRLTAHMPVAAPIQKAA